MKNRKWCEPVQCHNSPSCFTCPMGDCVANFPGISISSLNLLPGDLERMKNERASVPRGKKQVTAV